MRANSRPTLLVVSLLALAAPAFAQTTPTGAPPNPNLSNVFNTAPVGALTGNSAIAVGVHGFNSNPAVWANQLTASIAGLMPNDTWDGWGYDWSQDAAGFVPTPAQFVSAQLQGQYLAKTLLGGNYSDIHLYAHSLGGRVIETAATILAQAPSHPTVQTTFLDPYTPISWNLVYGSTAKYADEIVNTNDLLDTSAYLPNTFVVDVTPAGPPGNAAALHGWPYQWYQDTVTNFNPLNPPSAGLGFPLSLEQGGANWPAGNPARGTVKVMNAANNAVANMTTTPAAVLSNGLSLNPGGAVPIVLAKSSDNVVLGDNLITMHTSNNFNEWVNLALDLTAPANYVDFKFNFSTSEDGTLSVRLDNNLLWAGLDRFALTNLWEDSGLLTWINLAAGQHVLSFRLDSGPSDGGTTVMLQDIRAGLIAVPEPATCLALLASAAASAVARRRR